MGLVIAPAHLGVVVELSRTFRLFLVAMVTSAPTTAKFPVRLAVEVIGQIAEGGAGLTETGVDGPAAFEANGDGDLLEGLLVSVLDTDRTVDDLVDQGRQHQLGIFEHRADEDLEGLVPAVLRRPRLADPPLLGRQAALRWPTTGGTNLVGDTRPNPLESGRSRSTQEISQASRVSKAVLVMVMSHGVRQLLQVNNTIGVEKVAWK